MKHPPGAPRILLDPGAVLGGHTRPSARDLVLLIRDVNPTGLGLPAKELARRYQQKSRLQTLLIERFEGELDVRITPEQDGEGIVLLHHRPSGLDACHAVVDELGDEARSWIRRTVDLAESDPELAETTEAPVARKAHRPRPGSTKALLAEGQEAQDAYDYELARERFTAAFERSEGGADAAIALLSLLVDCLVADRDALDLEERMGDDALRSLTVRLKLGVAAARCGETERALHLVAPVDDPRVADVFVALASAAIEAGDLEAATRHLAAASARDAVHAEIAGLRKALASQQAGERIPLEREVARLLDDRLLDEAEAKARALLARFPASEVARRTLHAVDEVRRTAQGEHLVASAEALAARGDLAGAVSLFRQGIAALPRGTASPALARRADEVEALARAREERAKIEATRCALRESDYAAGLLGYLALNDTQRRALRTEMESHRPELAWLDDLGITGGGARARAAVIAVVALRRAEALVAEEPEAALHLLEAHDKTLGGLARADGIAADAGRRIDARRRAAASRRFVAACEAEARGALDESAELLSGLALTDVTVRERALAEELGQRLEHVFEMRRLVTSLETLRAAGSVLPARDIADKLIARTDGGERARWTAVRAELAEATARAFCVRIDLEPVPLRTLRDIDSLAWQGAPRQLCPTTGCLVEWDASGHWVNVRKVDLFARVVRARLALRTPLPMRATYGTIASGRLTLVDRSGATLAIDLDTLEVKGWHTIVYFPHTMHMPEHLRPLLPGTRLDFTPETHFVEDAVAVPGTSFTWYQCMQAAKRVYRVVDLSKKRILRDLHVEGHLSQLGVIPCRDSALMVVFGEHDMALYQPNGTFIDRVTLPGEIDCGAFAEFPPTETDASTLLVVSGATAATNTGAETKPATPARPFTFRVPQTRGVPPTEHPIDIGHVAPTDIAVDAEAGLVFAYYSASPSLLVTGLRAGRTASGAPSLEMLYHAPVPGRTILLQGGPGRGVLALAPSNGDFEVVRLSTEPPVMRASTFHEAFQVPGMALGGLECFWPTGDRWKPVAALYATMNAEAVEARARRLKAALAERDVTRLVNLHLVFLWLGDGTSANHALLAAAEHDPASAEVQVLRTRVTGTLQKWRDIHDSLMGVDLSVLDTGSATHAYHVLAVSLLHLGEPDEARAALLKAEAFEKGRCDLTGLRALLTPSDEPDDSEGRSDQASLIRALVRAIAAADACLDRGDAAGACDALDILEVCEALEVQSLARRAEAWLLVEEPALWHDKAKKLAVFLEAHAERRPGSRHELPLPVGRWNDEKLDELAERATRWLDDNIVAALPAEDDRG